MLIDKRLLERWEAWKMGVTICSEMEVSALFILGSIYKLRTGGVMLITGNQESGEKVEDRNWKYGRAGEML